MNKKVHRLVLCILYSRSLFGVREKAIRSLHYYWCLYVLILLCKAVRNLLLVISHNRPVNENHGMVSHNKFRSFDESKYLNLHFQASERIHHCHQCSSRYHNAKF